MGLVITSSMSISLLLLKAVSVHAMQRRISMANILRGLTLVDLTSVIFVTKYEVDQKEIAYLD